MQRRILGAPCIALALLIATASASVAEGQMWVTADALQRRTCASTACGAVGKLFFREPAIVLEVKEGWGRISKYYDASCANGRSEYVDSGRAECVPENGITNGKFAEWVHLDFLSDERPQDPGADADGTAKIVAQSDDFRRYQSEFVEAADELIAAGQCTAKDLADNGGWIRSTNKGAGVYFTYCRDGSARIYLDVRTGATFR